METEVHLEFIKLVSKKQIRSPELRRRAKAFPGRKIDRKSSSKAQIAAYLLHL